MGFLVAALAIIALPLIFNDTYWRTNLTLCAINVLLALGLDFILGYAGQLNLGHSAFYGLGAYVSTLLIVKLGVPFWGAFVAGVAFSGLAGMFLSLFAVRLRGHYLAIASLGFAVIIYQILLNWISLTQGPLGIYGIPPPPALVVAGVQLADFRNLAAFFYLVSGFTFLVYLLLRQLVRSPIGETLTAIREDEVSAAALGINGAAWKVFAFGVGAAVGGAAGCFYASFVGTLVPDAFFVTEAFNILAMVIVGGMGTLIGPVFGAILLTLLPEVAARDRRSASGRLWRRAHICRAVHARRPRSGCSNGTGEAQVRRDCIMIAAAVDETRTSTTGAPLLQRAKSAQELWWRTRCFRYFTRRCERLDLRDHRPERRRQIDAAQSDQRHLSARFRVAVVRWSQPLRDALASACATRSRTYVPEDTFVQATQRARQRPCRVSRPSQNSGLAICLAWRGLCR